MTSHSKNSRKRDVNSQIILLSIAAWIIAAEAVTTFHSPTQGMWLYASLLILLVVITFIEKSRPVARTWLCLAFVPLIRVISLSMPLSGFRLIHWYLLTGLPILLAAFASVRYFRLPRERFGLQVNWSPSQWLVGLTGLGLGYVEYLILRPQPLVSEVSFLTVLEALLILVIFTGLAEEVIFRGLMQHATERVFGGAGVVYVAFIFTVMHLGYHSLADLIFVFVVALYFGYYVRRTRSILGVTLAHGLTNIALFLIFPFVLASSPSSGDDVQMGVLSPPLPTPTVTPTPFRPYTPTPFLPDRPTPIESVTPSPEASLQFDTQAVSFLEGNTIRTPALATRALNLGVQYVGCGDGTPAYAGWSGRRSLARNSGPQLIFAMRTPVHPPSDWRFN